MEPKLRSRIIISPEEKEAMFRLRHAVYCDEMNWVQSSPDGLEKDDYDDWTSAYIGTFTTENELVACQRIIRSPHVFMVDEGREYQNIGKGLPIIKSSETAEISRLTIKKEYRLFREEGKRWTGLATATMETYLGMYLYCVTHGIRYLYVGASRQFMINVRRRFYPIKIISEYKEMEDGCLVEVGMIDWRKFELVCKKRHPEMSQYFGEAVEALISVA